MTKDLNENETMKLQELKISISLDGLMQWEIPKDITIAVFLHKQLDVIISQMINAKLQRSFEQTPKIVKPGIIL